ncbi:heterokaryon incompatibility protein-domain-containing protein [Cladorrhinum sp. PSN259]|nr:heterokaryon incompatibility protein-domain-containing protein [Cladorrhinum sp. PSN259]
MRRLRLSVHGRGPFAPTHHRRTIRPTWHRTQKVQLRHTLASDNASDAGVSGRFVALALGGILAALYGTSTLVVSFLGQLSIWHDRFRASRVAASTPAPDYAPLDDDREQIRLLVLERGDDSAQVRCRLEHVSLAASPRFEALSYVWGASSNDNLPRILCNGKEVSVGQNLYSALRNLRHPDSERVLWVDALCINQRDPLEQGKQIPLMGRIYEQANPVIIWLGEPTKNSNEAMPTLRKLNEHFTASASLPFYGGASLPLWARLMLYTNFPFIAAAQWRKQKTVLAGFNWGAVADVLNNPWFVRAWVFQELAKATSAVVVLGRDQMPLSDFVRPIAQIQTYPVGKEIIGPHLSGPAWGSLMTVLRIVTEDGPEARNLLRSRPSLLHLVARESFRDVTNERDRVFAFLDVANDVDVTDWEVLPDYTASVGEVYLRFARWCLLRKNNPEILQYAGKQVPGSRGTLFADPSEAALPSWVPDWRYKAFDIITPIIGDYNASGTSKLHVSWRPDEPALLRIKGRIVDTVDEVSISRMHLILLDHYELAAGQKFDLATVQKKLKRDQRFRFSFFGREQALPGDVLSNYVLTRDRQGLTKPFDIRLLGEAQEARQRFATETLPAHEMTNLVWMENCIHIAAKCTGGRLTLDRLDALRRTMTYSFPGLPKQNFVYYLAFLDEIGQGKRVTKALQGTAFALPRNRARAAGKHLSTARRGRQLQNLPSMENRLNPQAESEELQLRHLMHNVFSAVVSRRFCATSQNRLGWVPISAQAGDVICVLDGVKLPVVLRPLPKNAREGVEEVTGTGTTAMPVSDQKRSARSSTRYELMGPCYVDGMMHGELMKRSRGESRYLELC